MKNQLTELLTEFGQIDELFMDYTYAEGENGKNSKEMCIRDRVNAVKNGLWFTGYWRIPWQAWTVRIKEIDPNKQTVTHSAVSYTHLSKIRQHLIIHFFHSPHIRIACRLL